MTESLYSYTARVEQAVRDSLNAEVLALRLVERTAREGYWENIYNVAWRNERECGTHRVCINGEGDSMCVWGHYMMDAEQALADLEARS